MTIHVERTDRPCLDVQRTGRHWFIYVKHRCGPASLKCTTCGYEVAA